MDVEYFEENLLAALELGREFMYKILVEYGNRLEPFPPELMTEENRVAGCASTVYIDAVEKDGRFRFRGDSDSVIVKGQVYIITQILNGSTADEIRAQKGPIEEMTRKTGINTSLIPTRQNSMGNIYNHIIKKVGGVKMKFKLRQ